MPRRRMIDPSLTDDLDVAQLSMQERWFLLGCVRNSDDEGRLQGHQGFIKSQIFPYDDDIDNNTAREIRDAALKKMETWDSHNVWLLRNYQNGIHQFLYFPNWLQFNKPSHGVPSRLPPPPQSLQSTASLPPEARQSTASESPSQVRLGQSSLGKVSLGKVSAVQEDFTKLLDSENDLTDRLTTTLEKFLPTAPLKVMPVIKDLWRQATRTEMDGEVFQAVFLFLQRYPIPVSAKSIAKAVKYSPGKTKPAKYVQVIFEEQMKEYDKIRSP